MENTKHNIQEIIQSRDFSQLIGLKEDLYFDAKNSKAYNIDSPEDKYELAKDVSAFANNDGGYVIIGLQTDTPLETNIEVVTGSELLQKDEFPIKEWKGIISGFIHPKFKLEGVEIKWIEDINNNDLGIVYIYIPTQKEDNKYFLINQVREDGRFIKRIVFGLAIRKGSGTNVLTVKELYNKVQYGKHSTPQQLSRIEGKIDFLIESRNASILPTSPIEKMDKRIEDIGLER